MIIIQFLRLMRTSWIEARRQQRLARQRYPHLCWED